MIEAITTFNDKGLAKYGLRMMETFIQHWPIKLHVHYEGWNPADTPFGADPALRFHELLAVSDWLPAFKERHKHRHVVGFRDDAVRFSHKVAALIHMMETSPAKYLLWMDGDIVTHTPIMTPELQALLPDDEQLIAWLDRARAYPECGFYIINTEHRQFRDLLLALRQMYAGDGLFRLKEWHDSYILEHCVKELRAGTKSLSGQAGRKTHHPFVNGPLGQWMDHLKGARKDKGRSNKSDMMVTRTERYWS